MRTEQDYIKAAKQSSSLADMCRFFNLVARGANYDTMKHAIARYSLDVTHFDIPVYIQDNHGKPVTSSIVLKKRLVALYGYKCSSCKISSWNNEPITLQVDHIDGNNTNNVFDNLRLLCPTCHSNTETYCIGASGVEKKARSSYTEKLTNSSSKHTASNLKDTYKPLHKIPKEVLEAAVTSSLSYSTTIKSVKPKYNIKHETLVKLISYYKIDISHFTGKGWNKGNTSSNPKSKAAWKNKLVFERSHKCESCNKTKWLNNALIPLELEHIDGNNKNNNSENLKLLCPNCHSQTKTWKRKKISISKQP